MKNRERRDIKNLTRDKSNRKPFSKRARNAYNFLVKNLSISRRERHATGESRKSILSNCLPFGHDVNNNSTGALDKLTKRKDLSERCYFN